MSDFGYIRVSTTEQNADRQLIAMSEVGVPKNNIYMDKQSGKNYDRPEYKRMMRKIKPGDVVYFKSIDRMGRNYKDTLDQWRIITKEKRADIVVIDIPVLDTRQQKNLIGTLISDLVLQLLSYVSETERNNIKQRQAEGIAAAKKRGVRFGRPPKEAPQDFGEIIHRWEKKELTIKDITERYEICPSTFYKLKREWEIRKKNRR